MLSPKPWEMAMATKSSCTYAIIDSLVTYQHVLLKDIVQPKKRGVKRGTIRFVLTCYTIADIF
jgi:hypothetical protein